MNKLLIYLLYALMFFVVVAGALAADIPTSSYTVNVTPDFAQQFTESYNFDNTNYWDDFETHKVSANDLVALGVLIGGGTVIWLLRRQK